MNALDRLDLDAHHLRALTADDRFSTVMTALLGVIEPAARLQLAYELFGRRGAELPLDYDPPRMDWIADDLYAACSRKLGEAIERAMAT